MSGIKFIDATLRDGNHALKQQISTDTVEKYCRGMDGSGVEAVIVGHGNGLGASSLQVGLALETDEDLLGTARKSLRSTKLGAYLIPGFGTIKDDIDPALDIGVDLFKIGCHCTEADTTRQHIEYVKFMDKTAYGILMMYHLATTDRVLEEAKKMQSYGADGVILMDSAGASTPIEAVAALLQKEQYDLGLNLYQLFDVSKEIVAPLMNPPLSGLDDISIVSGMAGVFSAFKVHVINASREFKVDPRDIFMELGRQKVVAGQEDKIVEIAEKLQKGEIRR